MPEGFPIAYPGQAVGLLGGSFDPPHAGHVHVTREALKRFGLDQVWWLVSPGNPLKAAGPAEMARRLAACRALVRHPRVAVTDLERHLGSPYTAHTLARVAARYPGVRFVWLMGADNLAQFHRWERWEEIMATTPVGVIARPGARASARMAKAAERYWPWRVPQEASRLLPRLMPPAWCFVNVPMQEISSSAIRAGGGWAR